VRKVRVLLVLVGLTVTFACTATYAHAAGGVYIALGDSYTSGPLVPNQHGTPIDCGRSDHNYPSLTANAFKPAVFVDVSCGSAETEHMTNPQTGLPAGGTNPPQFNALRKSATLVTVGIGGNDAGLVGVAEECAQLGATAPTGKACRNHYAPGGKDKVAAKIASAKPKIAGVLEGIHARSPRARVAIVGYPHVTPPNGQSCYPTVPLSPDDLHYLDQLIQRINTMIAGQARAHDAEYVDTYRDSGGHDVCKLPPNRWFEGLVPTEPAFPLHPNAKGEASMGRSTIKQLRKPRPRPAVARLKVSPKRFKLRRRTRIAFRLSKAATVVFKVRRVKSGRRVGGRCVALKRSNGKRRRCWRYTRVLLRFRVAGGKGPNSLVRSSRRLGRRSGLYRMSATPTIHGATGRRALVRYRIRPRR
jgi:lysophospholipase L1-like esterase